jgi:hypothetical protein
MKTVNIMNKRILLNLKYKYLYEARLRQMINMIFKDGKIKAILLFLLYTLLSCNSFMNIKIKNKEEIK